MIEAALAPRVHWLWYRSPTEAMRPPRLHAFEGAMTRSVCRYADRRHVHAEGDRLYRDRFPEARPCRRCEQLLRITAPDMVATRPGKDGSGSGEISE